MTTLELSGLHLQVAKVAVPKVEIKLLLNNPSQFDLSGLNKEGTFIIRSALVKPCIFVLMLKDTISELIAVESCAPTTVGAGDKYWK
jgi:hypothetical protein